MVHRFAPWGLLAGGVAAGCLLHLGALVPEPWPWADRHPRAVAALAHTLGLGAFAAYGVALWTSPVAVRVLDWVEVAVVGLGLSLLLANATRIARGATATPVRHQARVFVGGMLGLVLSGALFLAGLYQGMELPTAVLLLPLWAFGLVAAYLILEHDLFEVTALVRHGATLALLVGGSALLGGGVFLGARRWLDPMAAWALAATVAAGLLAVVAVLDPVRRRVESAVEAVLLPRQRQARHAVDTASRELGRLRDEAELARFLRDVVATVAGPTWFRLLAGAADGPLVDSETGATGFALAPASPLQHMARTGGTLVIDAARLVGGHAAMPGMEPPDARLVVGLPPLGGHVGLFVLGPRADGRFYSRTDEVLLETLAGQAAVALENARAWATVRTLEKRLAAENVYLRQEVATEHAHGEIIGRSPAIAQILAQIERIAPTGATVLVIGETGTGKELVVRALHARSARADRTLVKLACAALPEQLLESELFGHERGAFTGATAAKPGRLEVADGGTLFLDDVDTLSLAVQAKLLRALELGETQRLGSNSVRRVDLRIVAATNRDLLAEVRAGRFREDLYYRLHVVPIELPSLRARRDDIPRLVEHFVDREAVRLGRQVRAVAAEMLVALQAYDWPGNVRELRNVIERAMVLGDGDVLRLPAPLVASGPGAALAGIDALRSPEPMSLADEVRQLKVRLIRAALATAGGNHRIAAERLGLHRQSLTRMVRDLAADDDAPRPPSRR